MEWSEYLERIGDSKKRVHPQLGARPQIIKLPSIIVSESKYIEEFVNEVYHDF